MNNYIAATLCLVCFGLGSNLLNRTAKEELTVKEIVTEKIVEKIVYKEIASKTTGSKTTTIEKPTGEKIIIVETDIKEDKVIDKTTDISIDKKVITDTNIKIAKDMPNYSLGASYDILKGFNIEMPIDISKVRIEAGYRALGNVWLTVNGRPDMVFGLGIRIEF